MAKTGSPVKDGGGWAFRDCVGEITDASLLCAAVFRSFDVLEAASRDLFTRTRMSRMAL